jgi:hypothetical protein
MLKALDMLLYLSLYLTDETNLDRLLPYVVDMLADDSPMVRCAACRALTQVVSPRCAEAWRLKASPGPPGRAHFALQRIHLQ